MAQELTGWSKNLNKETNVKAMNCDLEQCTKEEDVLTKGISVARAQELKEWSKNPNKEEKLRAMNYDLEQWNKRRRY